MEHTTYSYWIPFDSTVGGKVIYYDKTSSQFINPFISSSEPTTFSTYGDKKIQDTGAWFGYFIDKNRPDFGIAFYTGTNLGSGSISLSPPFNPSNPEGVPGIVTTHLYPAGYWDKIFYQTFLVIGTKEEMQEKSALLNNYVYNFAIPADEMPSPAASSSGTKKTFKIMPLGDSITAGLGDGNTTEDTIGGYRTSLSYNLNSYGYSVDFVGSQTSGPASLIDKNHEGHISYSIGAIASQIDNWLTINKPDVILLMVGVNDIVSFKTPEPAQKLGNLIDTIIAKVPEATVLVSSITPIADQSYNQAISTYNSDVQSVVSAKKLQGKKVVFIDMNPIITVNDLSDGVHPNAGGYQKMGNAWYAYLNPILNSLSSASPSPSVTTKPGDTDNDGDVDIFDYNLVVTDFGKINDPNTKADLDNDNDVDIFDYNLVIQNFNR